MECSTKTTLSDDNSGGLTACHLPKQLPLSKALPNARRIYTQASDQHCLYVLATENTAINSVQYYLGENLKIIDISPASASLSTNALLVL